MIEFKFADPFICLFKCVVASSKFFNSVVMYFSAPEFLVDCLFNNFSSLVYTLILFVASFSCLSMFSFSSLNIFKTMCSQFFTKQVRIFLETYCVPLNASRYLSLLCDLL